MSRFIPGIFVLLAMFVAAPAQKDISPDAVRTTVIDADGLRTLVSESDGPLLVNFWATWCGPCRAEFPDLVRIDEDYRDKGLSFKLVSIDNVGLADTGVSDFLTSYGAEMESFLLDLEDRRKITRALRRVAPRFAGTFPATMLFDRNGRLVYLKHGVVNDRILRAKIDLVLKK